MWGQTQGMNPDHVQETWLCMLFSQTQRRSVHAAGDLAEEEPHEGPDQNDAEACQAYREEPEAGSQTRSVCGVLPRVQNPWGDNCAENCFTHAKNALRRQNWLGRSTAGCATRNFLACQWQASHGELSQLLAAFALFKHYNLDRIGVNPFDIFDQENPGTYYERPRK